MSVNDELQVGQRIREARDAQGLSQRDLAARIGATQAAIYNWENGRRGVDTDLLPALARALGKSPEWFVTTRRDRGGYPQLTPDHRHVMHHIEEAVPGLLDQGEYRLDDAAVGRLVELIRMWAASVRR